MPRVKLFRYGVQIGKWSVEWTRKTINFSREISPEEAREKYGFNVPTIGTVDDVRYLLAVPHYLRAGEKRTATLVEDGHWTIAPPASHTPVTFESIWRALHTMCEPSTVFCKTQGREGQFLATTPSKQDGREPDEHLGQTTFTLGPPRTITIELLEID